MLTLPIAIEMALCRDSTGNLPHDMFKLLTCSMCYLYLFSNNTQLKQKLPTHPRELLLRNKTYHPISGSYILPDIRNGSIRVSICTTLSNTDCVRWTDCCESALTCCKTQLSEKVPYHNTSDVTQTCPSTWDGYGCWMMTKPGMIAQQHCPSYIQHADPQAFAYKDCTVNGSWWRNPQSNKEWTNYSTCVPNTLPHYRMVSEVAVTCSAISVLLLVPAMGIFAGFRPLYKQHRIKLHLHLFASFVLTGMGVILWEVLVLQDRLQRPAALSRMYRNTHDCKLLYVLSRYSQSTNFFWMFTEGFYLHRLMVNTFEPPKHMIGYYIFGWGASFVPVLIYSIIRLIHADTECWVPHIGAVEWIIYTPNLLCILANLFFLARILHILLTQLHSHPNEPSNYRRALKATFILVPLFGTQLVLVIYRPYEGSVAHYPYQIISAIVINSQGTMIALILCFFNGEVHNHLSIAYRRLRASGENSRFGGKYVHSNTACTQMNADLTNGHKTKLPTAIVSSRTITGTTRLEMQPLYNK